MRSIRPTHNRSAAISEARIIAPVHGATLRRGFGLSLSDIARDVGVARQTVWAWEHGRTLPSGENAERYLDVLRGLESLTQTTDNGGARSDPRTAVR